MNTLQTPPEGRFAAINGIEMYYEVHGEGEPLILLHGTPSTGRFWQEYIPAFAAHYQVIIPDLRGYGRSNNPQRDFTHRQLAVDVLTLLDQLQIGVCRAIGLSSGAITLLYMATLQPDRLSAMVLVGAAPYVPQESRQTVAEWIQQSETWDWEAMRQVHERGDEQLRNIVDSLHFYVDNVDDVNFTHPYLAKITAKTLIIHGDRDEHFPVGLACEMYAAIPHAYLWVVPNAGHVCIREQHAAPFIENALAFLRGVWNSA